MPKPPRRPAHHGKSEELNRKIDRGFARMFRQNERTRDFEGRIRGFVSENPETYTQAVQETEKLLKFNPGVMSGEEYEADVHGVALGMILIGLTSPEGKGFLKTPNGELQITLHENGKMEFVAIARPSKGPETN